MDPSWTRTFNEVEAFTLLDVARPGTTLSARSAEGHDRLPQGSLARRPELLKNVREDLLDRDGTGDLGATGKAARRKFRRVR